MYRVTTLSVPIETTKTSVSAGSFTKLVSQPLYIAISRDKHQYTEIGDLELDLCTKHEMHICTATMPTKNTKNPTCLLALLLDKTPLVHNLCDFNIFKSINPLPSIAIPINQDSYLTRTNEAYITIFCNNKTSIINSIGSYLILKTPCRCKIIVDTLTLTNGNPICITPKIHDFVIYYTYNLPALYHFDKTFISKSGSEISLTLPKVNSVYIKRLHDRLSHNPHAESMNILDLRRTALSIKNRPYHISHLNHFLSSISSVVKHPVLECLSLILSIGSILMSFYLWRKLCGIWTMLMFGHRISALNFTAWSTALDKIKTVETQLSHDTDKPVLTLDYRYSEITVLLVIILCIYIIKKCIMCKCKRPTGSKAINHDLPYLALKIYRKWDGIIIPLTAIKYEPNIFNIVGHAPLIDFHIVGCLYSHANFRWQGNLYISIDKVIKQIELPFEVYIPIHLRINLWKALRNPQTPRCGLVIIHREKQHQIPISTQESETNV